MPRLVVAVPLAKCSNSLVVAAATLRTFMVHDCVLHATLQGEELDPEEDAIEDVFTRYVLLDRVGDAGRPYWLAGVCMLPIDDIERARDAMGRGCATFVRVVEVREWSRHDDLPLLEREDLVLDDLAEVLGIALPSDAEQRVGNIVRKHAPPRFRWRVPGDGALDRLSATARRVATRYLTRENVRV